MTWLSIIASALAILRAVVEYLGEQKVIDAATEAAVLNGLRESDEAIAKARAARLAARGNSGDPRLSDDGFERKE